MYLIISGTNRKDSFTLRIAKLYQSILKKKNIETPVLSLVGLDLMDRNRDSCKVGKKMVAACGEIYIYQP